MFASTVYIGDEHIANASAGGNAADMFTKALCGAHM